MAVKGKTKSSNAFFKKILSWNYMKGIFVNPSQLFVVAIFTIFIEIILNILIVEKVPYTEIDWKAYMQECEGFLNGTFDYSKLKGDTGPLVYPAGFVYIYSALYYLTNQGVNIKVAQYIFIGIYVLQLSLVFQVYIKTKKVPPYVLLITILTSYRIHSIYVLRLFNDPIAVLFFYASLNLFLNSKWYLGSIFYSLGVSIKMNILLYAPALFFFYLVNLGIKDTLKQLIVCGLLQLLLGLPFLLSNPVAYIRGSFDLSRVFNHTWTVNYRFLDKHVFENHCFHLTLLLLHAMLLIIFLPMCIKYFKSYCRLRYVQYQIQPQINKKNLENKKKNLNNARIRKSNMKKTEKNESLSKEQEDFLKSFEKSLQKTQSDGKKIGSKDENREEETHYSIDFDILSQLFILPMYIVNFIGVVCARSLHYQFYSWYFHSLPYLVWSCNYSTIIRFLILALIELCWNTYPSTNLSSALLHICHLVIMYGVYDKMSKELKAASKIS